ncbi:FIST C-terminal domain-containing protein [Ruminococcaceae bacterium OttesenSCG-928-L11]|nr:FIST C-terminal domain-containing protein [Ruminococcaceae bacterium OttesenSCG-928-L11]
MESAIAFTYELDDAALGAEELSRQILSKLTLRANSIGILFCDSDADYIGLLEALAETLPVEIIGCTSVGMLGHETKGFDEICVSLTVLTADDCLFSTALSEPMTEDNAAQAIRQAYLRAASAIEGQPKLIYTLTRGAHDIMTDVYPDTLSQVSGGAPVFGGVPSGNEGDVPVVFYQGAAYEDRTLLLLVGGDIEPIFECRSIHPDTVVQKRPITRCTDNIIYEIGGEPVFDYLKSLQMNLNFQNRDDMVLSFLSKSLYVEDVESDISFVRTIRDVDLEKGYVVVNNKIKQGDLVSLGILSRKDIHESVEECIDTLLKKVRKAEEGGRKFGVILCTSCIARYLILSPDRHLEGKALIEGIGEQIPFTGFYSWGEICPLFGRDNACINKSHDKTMSMCAL